MNGVINVANRHFGVGDFDHFGTRLIVLRFGDEVEFQHAFQNVALTLVRAFAVFCGVVAARCLRQCREHGGFSQCEVFDVFVKIDVGGGGETVGAFTQINVVHIAFENLVFGEVLLDFFRHQGFVKFTRVGAFAGQKEVFCQLLGDGGGALFAAAGNQVVDKRARQTVVINAIVLVKTCVFNRQQGFFQMIGHFVDVHRFAAFLAKFADHFAICAVNLHGHARFVVLECINWR